MSDLHYFATQSSIAALQDKAAQQSAGPDELLALAWYQRQSDSRPAHALRAALPGLPGWREEQSWRLDLLQAELDWLQLRPAQAQAVCQRILARCPQDSQHGLLLRADCHALAAWLCFENSEHEARNHHLAQMEQAAQAAGDHERILIAQGNMLTMRILEQSEGVAQEIDKWRAADLSALPPAPGAILSNALGLYFHNGPQMNLAVRYYRLSWQHAQNSGQLRRACIAAGNISRVLAHQQDLDGALEWAERELCIARSSAWPSLLGHALAQYAECMQLLGRLSDARAASREALQILAPLAGSRLYAQALLQEGLVCQASGQAHEALQAFVALEELGLRLEQADFQAEAWLGQTRALLELGQAAHAMQSGRRQLQQIRQLGLQAQEMQMLQILAQISTALQQQAETMMWLQQAAALAQRMDRMHLPLGLLEMLSQAHQNQGELEQALEYTLQAGQAQVRQYQADLSRRATLLASHYEEERAATRASQLRELAASEAARAAALQAHIDVLSQLGACGRDLTARRSLPELAKALRQHAPALLQAEAVELLLPGADAWRTAMPGAATPDGLAQLAASCASQRHSLQCCPWPGARRSLCFEPLFKGGQLCGMLLTSSAPQQESAHTPALRANLAAYAAIALDNAQAWAQVESSRRQLVAQEKLASLGSLVAGVAHELNTPLGNALMMASSQQDALFALQQQSQLRHSDLLCYLEDGHESSAVLQRSLQAAWRLVSSFKQVAQDRTSEQARHFSLAQTTADILRTLQNRMRDGNHHVQLDIPPDITLYSQPGAWGQVLSALLENALEHGFAGRSGGLIKISARRLPGAHVEIKVCDNGAGIAAAHLKHIFDPFFTTRLGQGGNGLGLNICYNIVRSLLQGSIRAESGAGDGACFILDLPLHCA
ncbi:ATP-binding protein [Massilia sp. W12]|uniref:ATP-binding protein n=1 Tax=Massilia sp. W12 TaxID=3126507 RepID=UPI0030CE5B9B